MTPKQPRLQHPFAGAESGTISIDPGSNPWISDHTVRGLAVVPGAVYLEAIASEHFDKNSFGLADVEFNLLAPITQKALEFTTALVGSTIDLHQDGRDTEAAPAVRATIADDLSIPPVPNFEAGSAVSGPTLYERLRAAGNDYGPSFRPLADYKHSDYNHSGQISSASWKIPSGTGQGYRIHPLLLDLGAQVIGVAAASQNSTYLLRRIGRLVVTAENPGTQGTVVAITEPIDGDQLTGSAWILNDEGAVVAYCARIDLGLLAPEADEEVSEHLALASTFTVDPVADTVRLWSNTLGLSLGARVAPYGQVFQELLDPSSMLATSATAAAIIRLEDWTREQGATGAEAPSVGDEFELYTLPDGRTIASLNDYETRYLEREIFVDEAYARHDISFSDGDVIVDIGANIGMFSLFAAARATDLRIFAYEPSPVVFPILAANLRAHCPGAIPIQAGAGEEAGEADLTFYPRSSVFSGFNADSGNDGAALAAIIRNTVVEHLGGTEADVDAVVEDFMADRLQAETHTCRIESVSELIKTYDLDRIDLLKVDAEKSERAILAGIIDSDWPKIRQMVVEVHDQDGEGIEDVCELLRNKGFELEIEEEKLLENSGLYNIFCQRPGAGHHKPASVITDQDRARVQSLCDDLVGAVQGFLARGSNLITVFTPPTESPDAGWLHRLEADTVARLRDIPGSQVISSAELLEQYPVLDLHDPVGDRLGHLPYKPDFFAALGTSLVRRQQAIRTKPYKVLVLDCDNTLWTGAAGELGPTGVTVSAANRLVQERAKQLGSEGVVIALASKNDPATVQEVFKQNQDMVLSWDDVVTYRINWEPKSANIGDIAAELDLGLDSFIFIDDNPVEIAEVRSALPQVLSLDLPQNDVGRWLNNIWAFDRTVTTSEDADRSEMYRDAAARKREMIEAPSLESFIEGLELEVETRTVGDGDLERVSQLTQRTNQFNFKPKPTTVAELKALQAAHRIEIASVVDRFGSYGTVSVIIYKLDGKELVVDTFLLSCRVLGRGVEHEIMARLGRQALEADADQVRVPFVATDRNSPALKFLESTGATTQIEGTTTWFLFDSASLAELQYRPETLTAAYDEVAKRLITSGSSVDSAAVSRVAGELTDMSVVATLARHRPARAPTRY